MYTGPGVSYDRWVKAYGCKSTKSWMPYDWFDCPEKLDFPGLPAYSNWFSKLKGDYVLTLDEFKQCQRLFEEKGMKTFADWLEYYNNLDVVSALETLVKMREFYEQRELDVFKDAVSISGVSFAYVLRGSSDRGADLWGPNKEAYSILKQSIDSAAQASFSRDTTERAKQKYARTDMLIVKSKKKSLVLTPTRFTCTR